MSLQRFLQFVMVSLMFAAGIGNVQARTVSAAPTALLSAQSLENGTAGSEETFPARIWRWMIATQTLLHRKLTAAMRALKGNAPFNATIFLVLIAFSYGVLHSAGPGHGKSVISSYVLANEETIRRGIALSFLSAFFQALSAILFVALLLLMMRLTSLTLWAAEARLETLSWVLITSVGVWMLWRQVCPAAGQEKMQVESSISGVCSMAATKHEYGHPHEGGCSCGHMHIPPADSLRGRWSWKRALPIALAVGIRPCTGALLLLTFAVGQGMLWAALLGTLAMALGTAITVSALAALAASSRYWLIRVAGQEGIWGRRLGQAASVFAALLVILLGASGVVASWGPRPLGI